ncbi:hypothetical protein ASPVEDRAFT_79951 [Aspergillus versicolor CBS 583.65]|uniref:NmrA-like domain-containing protein n=1 Tax=Aspergillus versicolor CBS 583.65 TaxID=1036611 RepID=A0A1L9P9S9_ASPVE|nr:uncharacterized protein ASPVEDRAFT_79951 [Aspergillus versicolor CBS 583.65]OJI98290.1 hypothetical protein ASPVEDRAFT_79951 [Aspergillus versicolor CBS 583.65]
MSIFVCGATGTQGGALIPHLLSNNIKAHAIARDPSSKRALALKAAGVTIFPGSFDDASSLRTAMAGCTGLFLNLMPNLTDPTQELTQAKRILSIAKEAGVQHAIYSSGLIQDLEKRKYWNATKQGPIAGMLLSKRTVEEAVRTAGFEYYTILRPGNFMTNYLAPFVYRMYPGLVEKGVITSAFTPETVIPTVDPNDIGRFGAAAFLEPERFHKQEVGIASEILGLQELLNTLSESTGRELKVEYMTQEEIDAQTTTNPFLAGQLLARDMSDFVDMDEVRAWGIPLTTFAGFLEREGGLVKETFTV